MKVKSSYRLNYPDNNIYVVLKSHKNSCSFFKLSRFSSLMFIDVLQRRIEVSSNVGAILFFSFASATIFPENCRRNVTNAREQLCVVSAESFVVATSRKVATLI